MRRLSSFMRRALVLAAVLVPTLALAQPMPDDEGEEEPRREPASSASSSASAPDTRADAGAYDGAAPKGIAAIPSGSTEPRGAGMGPHAANVPHAIVPGMVFVGGGRFVMGAPAGDKTSAPNERPAHTEVVPPFYIDKVEVTVEAYRACVDRHACKPPERSSALCTYDLGDPLLPVSCVHWSDADTYCRTVGKRLPRETEWELAARGSTTTRYPWGGGAGCNFAATLLHESTGRSCSGKRPSRVGTHPSGQSPFGALDMFGNVEEWVSDFYVEHIAEGVAPRAGASHVLRGGGWLSPPSMAKSTSRNWGGALEAGPNVGLRCARDKD